MRDECRKRHILYCRETARGVLGAGQEHGRADARRWHLGFDELTYGHARDVIRNKDGDCGCLWIFCWVHVRVQVRWTILAAL